MALFKPKFITFDCYGTLINFAWMKCWAPGSLTTTW